MNKYHSLKSSVKNVFQNLKKMLSLAWQTDKFLTIGYFGTSAIGAFFPIVISYLFKLFIDELIAAQNIAVTVPVILIALLAARYIVNSLWEFVMYAVKGVYFDYLFRYKIQNELNYRFFSKVSKLDLAHFEDPETQNLITKAQDTFTWRPPDFLRQFQYAFNNFVSYISSFIVLLPFGWWIPLGVSVAGLPQLILRARFGDLQWSMYGSGAPEVKKLWYLRHLLSTKTSVYESQVFQSTEALLKKFKSIQTYLYKLNSKPVKQYLNVVFYPELIKLFILFGFAYLKLPVVLRGDMSVGDFTFFISMLDRLVNSAQSLVLNIGDMYENNLYVNHFFDVIDLKKLIKEPNKPKKVDDPEKPPHIKFVDVSFVYPGDKRKVIDNVSFEITPGENVALVGANGAGKTTLIKLLLRFYDVKLGKILIDGVDIKELDLDQWYNRVGLLFQEFVHYDFTVRENIMLGEPQRRDKKRMIAAAKAAGAEEFIKNFPKGYDQLLGRQFEGGKELSQGQWQKLAIARALYESAPLLVLDEPTSAIDAEAEYEIFKNLNNYYKAKSLLLISHRFSTVRNANKIIVLKKGKIVEEGSHRELIKEKGLYSRMFEKQATGYK